MKTSSETILQLLSKTHGIYEQSQYELRID